MARQPLRILLSLAPLLAAPLAAPLVLAQAGPDAAQPGGPRPASLPVAPPPPVEPAPAAATAEREVRSLDSVPLPTPAEAVRVAPAGLRSAPSPAPLLPSSETTGSSPSTLRPPMAELPNPQPRRFDQTLDSLIRDGVVSPREVRVRVHPGLISNPALLRQGCSSGAFSASECGTAGGDGGVVFRGRDDLGSFGSQAGGSAAAAGERTGIDAAPLPPISVPVSALLSGIGGNFRLTDVFRITPRPRAIGGNGNRGLLFPLIGSAETSSGFGWRLHPILGTWLMHSGRDLAAPEGTPVVASLSGRVVSSGDAGGYGLAVEIEHERPLRRTLYGHLSELYVKEGDRVRQGEVIGRVGSTGRSTGPHLHFEVRIPQEGGWVAIDPGDFDSGNGQPDGGLPGLAGLAGLSGDQAPDAVALLMGQLLQSLERPRSPLGTAPAEASTNNRPLPIERLPQPLPPSASLPAPAPLPRDPKPGRSPGG